MTSINGVSTPSWEQAEKVIRGLAATEKIHFEVVKNGSRREIETSFKELPQVETPIGYLPIPPVLDYVELGKPAKRAGMLGDDTILSVDGQKIQLWGQFVERVRGSKGKPLDLEILRKGQVLHKTVAPQLGPTESGEMAYMLGVSPREELVYKHVTFAESMQEARLSTFDFIGRTVGVVAKLFSGRVSVKQLHSVVEISRAAGNAVHRGPLYVVLMMAFMSINLGILNLLPIPILDGGNILLLTLEGIRRRDFSLAFKERFVQVGLVFLLVLFTYVIYNDVRGLLPTNL
jgi:regulator of sigma E protease